MKSLHFSRQVLWFLFLVNTAVAIGLHGHQRLMTSAGMGVVALGAGASLVLRRTTQTRRLPAARK
jgi:hypothetical protein